LCSASFEQDNGLDLGHLVGYIHETLGVLNALEVHENCFCVGIVRQIFENFAFVHIKLVAKTNDPGHSEVFSRHDIPHGMSGEISCFVHV
jgi:hypothetical protein